MGSRVTASFVTASGFLLVAVIGAVGQGCAFNGRLAVLEQRLDVLDRTGGRLDRLEDDLDVLDDRLDAAERGIAVVTGESQ